MVQETKTTKRLAAKTVLMASSALACLTASAAAQLESPSEDDSVDEIIVTGYRAALRDALQEERASDNLVEVIEAVDIGKLPD